MTERELILGALIKLLSGNDVFQTEGVIGDWELEVLHQILDQILADFGHVLLVFDLVGIDLGL